MLSEFLYISEAVELPHRPLNMGQILASARRRNGEAGVTGVLIYNQRKFIQLLEGPPEGLAAIYDGYIQSDPRHRRIQVVSQGAIGRRSFGAWSMGYAESTATTSRLPPSLDKVIYQLMSEEAQKGPLSPGVQGLLSLYKQLKPVNR